VLRSTATTQYTAQPTLSITQPGLAVATTSVTAVGALAAKTAAAVTATAYCYACAVLSAASPVAVPVLMLRCKHRLLAVQQQRTIARAHSTATAL
jgi:hypothetical protein